MTITREELVNNSKSVKANIERIAIPTMEGTLIHYKDFRSEFVRGRPVDVWLPNCSNLNSNEEYPVIYMHDGQMMFHHRDSSLAGMDVFWNVDEAVTRLINKKEIRPAIVVSVWMSEFPTGSRLAEYLPKKAITNEIWRSICDVNASDSEFTEKEINRVLSSDNYLKFLVEELKPFIDKTYPTLKEAGDTFMIGSSMGGLISAYAVEEYPYIFGGVACLSSDWAIGEGILVEWFKANWPAAGKNRIYFDYGTESFDALYEPYQKQMDQVMRKYGYRQGEDWTTLRFEGADHSAKAWRQRLHIPLKFLLGNT